MFCLGVWSNFSKAAVPWQRYISSKLTNECFVHIDLDLRVWGMATILVQDCPDETDLYWTWHTFCLATYSTCVDLYHLVMICTGFDQTQSWDLIASHLRVHAIYGFLRLVTYPLQVVCNLWFCKLAWASESVWLGLENLCTHCPGAPRPCVRCGRGGLVEQERKTTASSQLQPLLQQVGQWNMLWRNDFLIFQARSRTRH